MALTGVEIFKLLPKTNCKKCGHPTCLAFAMKLAQRQASLDACPDVSEEAKKVLGEASAPPIRAITSPGIRPEAISLAICFVCAGDCEINIILIKVLIPSNHKRLSPAGFGYYI